MKQLLIGDKFIGDNYPCMVVAEIGPNHNGSFEEACKLLHSIKAAGGKAVKFQFRRADLEIADKKTKSYYFDMPRYDFIKSVQEFTFEEHQKLRNLSKKLDLAYIVSIMTNEVVDEVSKLLPDAIKIPSGEVNNPWLLEEASLLNIPIIISSGMSTDEEIKDAIKLVSKNNKNIIFLHCLSEYPTKLSDMNLKVIQKIRTEFDVLTGLSDHSRQISSVATSVCYGACMIEVHFTHDRNSIGPDHHVSLLPKELSNLIKNVEEFETAKGNDARIQGMNFNNMRNSFTNGIVAKKYISSGEKITKDHICLRKPNNGISGDRVNSVIGSIVLEDVYEGTYLQEHNIKFNY